MRLILSPKAVTGDLMMSPGPHIYVVETLRYPEDIGTWDSPEPQEQQEPLQSVAYYSTLISANRAARSEAWRCVEEDLAEDGEYGIGVHDIYDDFQECMGKGPLSSWVNGWWRESYAADEMFMIRKTVYCDMCWSVEVSMKRLEGPDLSKGEIDSYSDVEEHSRDGDGEISEERDLEDDEDAPGVEVSVEVEAEGSKAQVIDESELGEPPAKRRKM